MRSPSLQGPSLRALKRASLEVVPGVREHSLHLSVWHPCNQGQEPMTLTESLAPHLPYLRRYARALTGSQTSGDAYVRAALTAVLAGKSELATDLPPRVALYRL